MQKSYLDEIDDVVGLSKIGDQASVVERLVRLDDDGLFEFHAALSSALPKPRAKDDAFRFVGNSELSGLPFPCASMVCRARGLNQSAFFSAAYADETILFNPFDALVSRSRYDYIEQLSFHICQLVLISPLIERGLVSFSDFHQHAYCEECFRRGMAAAFGGDLRLLFSDCKRH